MDENFYNHQDFLRPARISFDTNCGRSTEYCLPKDSVWVRNLSLDTDLILGLIFLLKDNGSIMISKDYIQLQKFTIYAPTYTKIIPSEYAEKHGGIKEDKECECSKERRMSINRRRRIRQFRSRSLF